MKNRITSSTAGSTPTPRPQAVPGQGDTDLASLIASGRELGDAVNWARGHWLNGRAGAMTLPELAMALTARGGGASALRSQSASSSTSKRR